MKYPFHAFVTDVEVYTLGINTWASSVQRVPILLREISNRSEALGLLQYIDATATSLRRAYLHRLRVLLTSEKKKEIGHTGVATTWIKKLFNGYKVSVELSLAGRRKVMMSVVDHHSYRRDEDTRIPISDIIAALRALTLFTHCLYAR
jgi:hypothetical protein